MKYFKNTELASIYHVSEKSVRNWIESAKTGKLDLQLLEVNDRHHVANTSKNTYLIENLVQKGKKYKNSRGFKTVRPSEDFYKVYSPQQIADIVSSLGTRKEIPFEYCYLNGGADIWDKYSNRLAREHTPNILNQTSELLKLSADYIDKLVGKDRKINVIDLGPGNGSPIRSTLERLVETGRLNRYIAIDISSDILDIVRANIKSWFGNKVKLDTHLCNFEENRFSDITFAASEGAHPPANLVFLLGGTISNFRQPMHLLHTINRSLQRDDLFFYSAYLDTPYTRRFFDFTELGGASSTTNKLESDVMLELLQLDETVCDIEEMLFDRASRCRFRIMRPRKDLTIEFKVGASKRLVELVKGESIILWRHQHYYATDLIELFTKNDFDVIQATKSEDQNYILLINKIKTSSF